MSESILYVEDGPDDVFFMQRAFQKIAPHVNLQVITNGQEAIDFFVSAPSAEGGRSLALVILDLNLRGNRGCTC